MAGSLPLCDWSRYERWNNAIADVVYSPEKAGMPVYLDLEEDVLDAVASRAEPGATDSTSSLVEAVTETLNLRNGASSVLREHLHRLDVWHRGSMLAPPPSLGLLAMLSLVAENMRQSESMRAHNFYGRLAQLAGFNEDQIGWFQSAYRDRRAGQPASGELWDSLNDWLEMMEGSRGLPTALPVGHEHIGFALSQALVRQADRDKFSDLFSSQGLSPGSMLPAAEMAMQIDEWMSRIPCPASNTLERLWKEQPSARQQIAEVACLTLETWDGAMAEGFRGVAHREIDSVRLKAVLRTFPNRRIELSMVIPGNATSEFEEIEILDHDDQGVASVAMVPCASGWLGVAADAAIDAGSFLEGQVRLRRSNLDHTLKRRPRRLVPLRRDDLLLAYIECERVQLGEESLVLCHVSIASQVAAFLTNSARPGFRQSNGLVGLPSGWTLFEGVQILTGGEKNPHQLVDLNVLQPLALSQVVLQGGLKLPGHLRKWLSTRPPELRASTDGGSALMATTSCRRALTYPTPSDEVLNSDGPVLIWDLADADLPDGDYDIRVTAGDELIHTELLRLRSADNPALQVGDDRGPIANDPEAPAFGLLACRSKSPKAFEGGADAPGALPGSETPSIPGWWNARAVRARPRRVIRSIAFPVDGPSCIKTGAHFMDLPSGLGGQTSIEGVCRYCGLVKRYLTRFRSKKNQTKADGPAPVMRLEDISAVRPENDIDWSAAFDAVCHVGSAGFSALDRITSQLEASDLFGDAFARTLNVLGHIEIERSLTTLEGRSWQVNDPLVIGLATGKLAVVGFRSEKAAVTIEDEVWAMGGELVVRHDLSAPPLLKVGGLDQEGALRLAKAIAAATGRPARYIPDAGARLAACLPPLSEARKGLPVISTLSARSFEMWNPVTARFEPASDAAAPGAFRLNGHTRTYVFRRPEDLGVMSVVLGDARIVKYLAAMDSGLPLVGYSSEKRVLYVPLGAELPGLFGRAAVFASGNPPQENTDEHILEYHGVPPELAAHLSHLLMS